MKLGSNTSPACLIAISTLFFLLLPQVAATIIYQEDFTDPLKLGNPTASSELGNGGTYAKGTWVFSDGNSGIDVAGSGDGSGSDSLNRISATGQARAQTYRGTNARAISVIFDSNWFAEGIEYTLSFDVIGDAAGANAGRYWLAFVSGYDEANGVAIDGTHNGWGAGAGSPKPLTASGGGNAVIQYIEDSSANGVLINGEDGAETFTVSLSFVHDGFSDVAFAVGTYNNLFAFDNVTIEDPNDGNLLPSVTINSGMSQYLEIPENSTQLVDLSASDPDGSISRIRALIDGQAVGEISNASNFLLEDTFVGLAPGDYVFEVVATDDVGGTASLSFPFYIVPADGELIGQRPHTLDQDNIKEYLRFVPPGYNDDPNREWPLMLWLHGAGARGTEALGLLDKGGPPSRLNNNSAPFIPQLNEFIVISPRVTTTWTFGDAQAEIDALVDAHVARFRIDPERLIITGQSMGGFGLYAQVRNHPNKYAAAVPLCGNSSLVRDIAEQFAHLPFWIFHDEGDLTILVEESDDFFAALNEAGAQNVKYSRLKDSEPNAHSIWWSVYRQPELYDWMLETSWLRKFYSSDQPLEPLLDLDTDGDGMMAREEFIAGTVPTAPESVFTILSASRNAEGTGFELSWSSVPGKLYRVYQNDDLAGEWEAIGQKAIPADPTLTNRLVLPNTAERMFYRVEVVR